MIFSIKVSSPFSRSKLRADHKGGRRGWTVNSITRVQRSWIIMQIAIFILVSASVIIAASKLWF
jgi:hypothetical protein